MIRSRLAVKLSLLVLLCSTIILGAVICNTYIFSRDLIVHQAEELSRSRGQAAADRIAVVLKPVEQSVRNIALAMEGWDLTEKRTVELTRLVVRNNPDIFGMAIAFAPHAFSPDRLYFAPYSFRKDGGVQTKQLGGSRYHYFDMDWFRQPEQRELLVWTEPYFDKGGADTFMVTCSMPFYRLREGKRTFAGVVTADITLGWLQRLMSGIRPYESGYAVLLSREGRFIYHPDERLRCNTTVFSLAETRDDPELQRIGHAMTGGQTAFLKWRDRLSGQASFLFYMPLSVGGWSLALVFPRDAVLRSAKVLTRNTLLIGGCGLLFFILAVILITGRVTRPIHDLSRAAMAIAGGNLNEPLPPVSTRDEVGDLAESFRIMQQSLRRYILDLEETTRRQERIESELRIAREIQMGILPKTFPPFPGQTEFSIFATLEPAREVGGDLYDFFLIDGHHLCCLVGDVSDKGVPAALFMAMTKILAKVVAGPGMEAGDILSRVSDELARDNSSSMFVTLFIAILDIRNGELCWANAGHNPPLLLRPTGTGFIASHNEPVAGVVQGIHYTTSGLTMHPGDVLFLYTDGVTEAMNVEAELFSSERLLDTVTRHNGRDPGRLIAAVQEAMDRFVGDCEQSDDRTMLALRFQGPARRG